MAVSEWSTTAGLNTPPEQCNPGVINDVIREMKAELRAYLDDPLWLDLGHACERISTTAFRISGMDVTETYHAERAVKVIGDTTGAIVTRITSSVYSSGNTTVNVQIRSGAGLQSEDLTVLLSAIRADERQFPHEIADGDLVLVDNELDQVGAVYLRTTKTTVGTVGRLKFSQPNDADADTTMAEVTCSSTDRSAGSEDANVKVRARIAGAMTDLLQADLNGLYVLGGIVQPAGAIMDFAGSVTPTGWLRCNGAAVSRTTYERLFGVIGTSFGVGDGSTTFNVPNIAALTGCIRVIKT